MEYVSGLIMFVALLVLLAGGVWIAIALFLTGFIALHFLIGAPAGLILATSVWSFMDNWTLTALPLFILMGELLFRTDLSAKIFKGLVPWTARLPGGLLHVNVIGCGVFSAVSGSSTATTATIGMITLPELRKRGYDERMAIGSLAASGTFGLLIPPSTMMIVYGFIAEVSIVKLFIAGILPGILLMSLFSGYIMVWSLVTGKKNAVPEGRLPFFEKLMLAREFIPVFLLIFLMMASMYGGWATATEAAALGVLGALVILIVSGSFTMHGFLDALLSATRTSCMLMFVLAGAAYVTAAMGFSGLPEALAAWIRSLGLGPWELIAMLTLLYIVLGLALDGLSMVVLTATTVLPMVQAVGIDLIWFGVFIVLMVEMSLITPPVGLNLFVMKSFTGHEDLYVARAALPFFFLMVAAVIILLVFPQIALYLPQRM